MSSRMASVGRRVSSYATSRTMSHKGRRAGVADARGLTGPRVVAFNKVPEDRRAMVGVGVARPEESGQRSHLAHVAEDTSAQSGTTVGMYSCVEWAS